MSYPPGRKPKKSNPLPAILILIGLAIVGAVGYGGYKLVSNPNFQKGVHNGRFDAEYAQDANFGPIVQKLKAEFPEEYEALKYNIIEAYKVGASQNEKDRLTTEFLDRFAYKHSLEIAVAPSANLKAIRDSQLATVEALQRQSEVECAADFVSGSANHGPEALKAAHHETMVLVDAAIAGRDTPVKPRGPRRDSDGDAMLKSMRQEGLTEALQVLLVDDYKLHTASVHDKCTLNLVVTRAMAKLPPDVADRYVANFIAEIEAPK